MCWGRFLWFKINVYGWTTQYSTLEHGIKHTQIKDVKLLPSKHRLRWKKWVPVLDYDWLTSITVLLGNHFTELILKLREKILFLSISYFFFNKQRPIGVQNSFNYGFTWLIALFELYLSLQVCVIRFLHMSISFHLCYFRSRRGGNRGSRSLLPLKNLLTFNFMSKGQTNIRAKLCGLIC